MTKTNNSSSNIIIWVLVVLLILVLGFGIYYYLNPQKNLTDPSQIAVVDTTKNISEDYPTVPTDNLFVYRSGQEIVDILSHGTGIVFLGFKECPWCQAYAPILNEAATEAGLEKIYYFDILNDRKDNTEVYQQIVALLGDNLLYDEEGHPRVYVPDVTFVKNGEIIAHNNETSMNTAEEHGTPEEFWTAERITALKTTLREDMEPIASSATCSPTGAVCN